MDETLERLKQFDFSIKQILLAKYGKYMPDNKVALLSATDFVSEKLLENNLDIDDIQSRIFRANLRTAITIETTKDVITEDGSIVTIPYGEEIENGLIEYYLRKIASEYKIPFKTIPGLDKDLGLIVIIAKKLDGQLDSKAFSEDAVKLLNSDEIKEIVNYYDKYELNKYLENSKNIEKPIQEDIHEEIPEELPEESPDTPVILEPVEDEVKKTTTDEEKQPIEPLTLTTNLKEIAKALSNEEYLADEVTDEPTDLDNSLEDTDNTEEEEKIEEPTEEVTDEPTDLDNSQEDTESTTDEDKTEELTDDKAIDESSDLDVSQEVDDSADIEDKSEEITNEPADLDNPLEDTINSEEEDETKETITEEVTNESAVLDSPQEVIDNDVDDLKNYKEMDLLSFLKANYVIKDKEEQEVLPTLDNASNRIEGDNKEETLQEKEPESPKLISIDEYHKLVEMNKRGENLTKDQLIQLRNAYLYYSKLEQEIKELPKEEKSPELKIPNSQTGFTSKALPLYLSVISVLAIAIFIIYILSK